MKSKFTLDYLCWVFFSLLQRAQNSFDDFNNHYHRAVENSYISSRYQTLLISSKNPRFSKKISGTFLSNYYTERLRDLNENKC